MTTTTSIINNNSNLKHILEDMRYAASEINRSDLYEMFLTAVKESGSEMWQTKKNAVKNTWSLLKKGAEAACEKVSEYRQKGAKQAFSEDIEELKDFVGSLPDKTKKIYTDFMELPKEQQTETALAVFFTIGIFFASCGGLDAEGGLPDTDIAIGGIGMHRSIFTHTVFMGLGLEFCSRFSLIFFNKIQQRLPEDKHPVWDKVYNFMNNNKHLFLGAMWLGIATHLLKDTGIITGGMKPYSELPNGLPIDVHQSLLDANTAASAIFAKE